MQNIFGSERKPRGDNLTSTRAHGASIEQPLNGRRDIETEGVDCKVHVDIANAAMKHYFAKNGKAEGADWLKRPIFERF